MVSRITQNVCQKPTPSSEKSGPSGGPSRKSPPSDSIKIPKNNGLDQLIESLQIEGISKIAATLTTNSQ